MTIEGTAQKCKKEGYGDPVQLVFEVSVPSGYTPTLSVGNKFKTNAYKLDKDSEILTVNDVKDIVKQ